MLKELLSRYDACKLECDGLTRVITTVLGKEGIEHTCMVGSLTHVLRNETVPLHFWIELADGRLVDYRAHHWLGEGDDIPHGIFDPRDYPHMAYQGQAIDLGILPQMLFDVLTEGAPD